MAVPILLSSCFEIILRSPLEVVCDEELEQEVTSCLGNAETALWIFMWVGDHFPVLASKEDSVHFVLKLVERSYSQRHREFIIDSVARHEGLRLLIESSIGCAVLRDIFTSFPNAETAPLVDALVPLVDQLLPSEHGCQLLSWAIQVGNRESVPKLVDKLCYDLDALVKDEDGIVVLETIIEHRDDAKDFCVNYIASHHPHVLGDQENITLLLTIVTFTTVVPIQVQEIVAEMIDKDYDIVSNPWFEDVVEILSKYESFLQMTSFV